MMSGVIRLSKEVDSKAGLSHAEFSIAPEDNSHLNTFAPELPFGMADKPSFDALQAAFFASRHALARDGVIKPREQACSKTSIGSLEVLLPGDDASENRGLVRMPLRWRSVCVPLRFLALGACDADCSSELELVLFAPCSCASWFRKDVVRTFRSCLDSVGVSGSFGCVKTLKLADIDVAGRRRREGVGWSMASDGVGRGVSDKLA